MKTLIITEKPSVAKNICTALNITDNGSHKGFIEDNNYIVSWCIGHLIELAEPSAYDEKYKTWNYFSLPIIPESWKYEVKEETREQFEILKALMNRDDVTDLIEATDCGREGEAIYRYVYKMAGCQKPFKRLWISSLEADAIRKGFENLHPGSDYDDLYASARCRQEADWLVGINGTRLFSTLYCKTLKVGRVQTPTLAALVNRESEITDFKKEPFYTVHIGSDYIEAISEPLREMKEARILAGKCEGKDAEVISVETEEKTIPDPALYDLTTLQREANRYFGYTAKQTLDYAQSLYEKRLITYPRTDSRYLSYDMEETAGKVLNLVKKQFSFAADSKDMGDLSKILDSSKVTDHHAIIPTAEIASLNEDSIPSAEMNILALIAARLACAVADVHRYIAQKAVLSCEGEEFTAKGKTINVPGWKEAEDRFKKTYGIEIKEKESALPALTEGEIIRNVSSKMVEGYTRPPKHFTEDSLLSLMEKAGSDEMAEDVERKGLGTPATRADIIEKLLSDGFVNGEKKQLIPTEDGKKLISVLPNTLKSAKLTSDWENELSRIAKGESDADSFMTGIKQMVRNLIKENSSVSEEQRAVFGTKDREILGKCPRCGCDVVKGRYGPYCTRKCGMRLGKALGKELNDDQLKKLLKGEKIFVKDIQSKKGKTYDAYLIPKGISDFTYTDKDGQEKTGFRFDYHLDFPG